MAEDLYQVLGVSRTADQKEIRRAYREKARKYHPDINKDPSAEEHFKRISEANDVLSDPETRARYDQFGEGFREYANATTAGGQRTTSRGPSGGQQRYAGWTDYASAGQRGVDWEDLFGGGFSGRRGRGADHSGELELTVEEAYRGGRRSIRVADAAGGAQDYDLDIPAGALDGDRIRIPGAGGTGWGQAGPGDLVVTLRVRGDGRYRLSGADIEMDLPISPWEAALGADVRTDAPGGPVTVHVPAGSSSGRRLRLRGQGMRRRSGPAGDLYARIKIVVPQQLSAKERHLFEQLRQESDFEPRKAS